MRTEIIVLLCILSPAFALADNVVHPGSPVFDRPTLTSLGVQLPITGDDNFNATVTVRYRKTGTGNWRQALPLFRVHPENTALWTVAPQFAGSVFDLRPNTSYDIELHLTDPDGPVDQVFTLTTTTRPVPADPLNPRIVNVSDVSGLLTALQGAQPGDIVTLADGFYNVGTIYFFGSGTAQNPIVIRGASEDGTVLDGGNCTACNVLEVYGSYVHIERLTLQNAFRALRFQTAGETGNVVRRVHMKNTTMAIFPRQNQTDFYICDNQVEGRLTWPMTNETDGAAHTNDDGLVVAGSGHVVCHNRISGFADAIQTNQPGSRANDFYGNEVLYTYDDGIELDSSEGNVRCFRNRFTNTFDTISLQPILGGPAYVFRNIVVNVAGEQMKFHSSGTTTATSQETNGTLAYHNTFVSPARELYMNTPASPHHFRIENNLFVGPAQLPGYAVEWGGPIDDGLFDYNGYFSDGVFVFNFLGLGYRVFSNFAAAQTGGLETHGRLLSQPIFASGLIAPPSYTSFMVPQDVTLASTSNALDRGLVLPNVNDGYTGAAPDLGAVESGCPTPIYGPRPAGIDESNEPFGCDPSGTTGSPSTLIRIRCGGPQITDANGNVWSADNAQNRNVTNAVIANTSTPALYQTEAWSNSSLQYQFAVPNGPLTVKLHFAEFYRTLPGQRTFNIVVNGTTYYTNFDILAAVPPNTAYDVSIPVMVSNGQITIQLVPVSGPAKLDAIEIF